MTCKQHIFDETDHCFECDAPRPMTAAQRKAAQRERQKAAGLVRQEVWVRPEHQARVVNYVTKLNKGAGK